MIGSVFSRPVIKQPSPAKAKRSWEMSRSTALAGIVRFVSNTKTNRKTIKQENPFNPSPV